MNSQSSFSGDVPIRGTLLHVEYHPGGRPLILLHAGITDSRMWDRQMAVLVPEFTVLRYDLRGFGLSELPPVPYAHHDDLHDLMGVFDIPSAIVAGASYGGNVASSLALEYPELVDALILVNSLVGNPSASDALREGWAEAEEALDRGDIAGAVEVDLRMWVDGPMRSPDMVDPTVREEVRVMNTILMERMSEQDLADEQEIDPPIAGRLPEIGAPTLVVVGDLDQHDAQTSATALANGIAQATLATIPGAAHLPSMERPDHFNRIVLEFMRSL